MKLTRHKRFRRILLFYKVHYRLNPPYSLVADSEFIQAALKGKVHLKDQLPKMMDEKCFPRVTGCTVNALRKKGEAYSGANLIAKRFERIQCGHGKPISEAECIAGVIKKKTLGSGVCAGVQDIDLRARIRFQMHFVPIIYIMGQVPILEEPASMAKGSAKEKESSGLQPTQWEKKVLGLVKEDPLTLPVKHKRKRREPNPLSCKKKRKISTQVPAQELPGEKQKKTRRKSRKTKEKSASITESQNNS